MVVALEVSAYTMARVTRRMRLGRDAACKGSQLGVRVLILPNCVDPLRCVTNMFKVILLTRQPNLASELRIRFWRLKRASVTFESQNFSGIASCTPVMVLS